ncbi:MAG: hypothetical protein ACK40L_05035, partial [Hydrogenophaga sp.]
MAGERPAPASVDTLLGSMNKPEAWKEVVRTRFSGTDVERLALSTSLAAIKQSKGLRDAELVVLAKCLALSQPEAAGAKQALQSLQQLDVVGALRAPLSEAGTVAPDAWALASQLQSVNGVGLRLLGKLSAGDKGPTGTYAANVAPLVRAYFLAASEVARASGNADTANPAALYASGAIRTAIDAERSLNGAAAWPGRNGSATPAGVTLSVAEKALLALRDEVDKANPAVTATHGCAFAIHMVRAGMLTDKKREANGELSEFHKVESRASKTFGKHIDRSIGAGHETKLKSMLAKVVPQIAKSPFHAHNKILAKEPEGISLSHDNGIHHGRAVKDMIGVVSVALKRANVAEGLGAQPLDPNSPDHVSQELQLRNQCRLAILELTDAETVLLPRFASATPLSEAQVEKALDKVMERLSSVSVARQDTSTAANQAAPSNAPDPQTPAPVQPQPWLPLAWLWKKAPAPSDTPVPEAPPVIDQSAVAAAAAEAAAAKAVLREQARALLVRENTGLTPQTLLAWAQAAGGPVNAAQLHELARQPRAEGEPDWGAFEGAFLRSTGREKPAVATPELKGLTREQVGSVLADMVRGEELGSGFALENGGLSHVHTGAISQILSGLATGGAGSIRLDLGGGQRRVVTFESGVGTDRSFIKVGVSTLKRAQLGAGGSGGAEIGETGVAKASASGGANAQRAWEVVHHEGTIFGFPRHLSGGVGGD